MHEAVFASGNAGKIREINAILQARGYHATPQSAFGLQPPEETGLSFVENAILKARYAAQHTGLPAFADDSGLEVDALQGAPGIYSARFAGDQASDVDNVNKLLHSLRDTPTHLRDARYRCVIVYLRHANDPMPSIFGGTWEGRILSAPIGNEGFGYDPIFWVPTHQCSAAQLEPAIKNNISHRALALRQLLDCWT
jgi:XTP/dITP diphosphohydrolase